MKHMPMTPHNLKEWKSEAQGCLSWCGALGDNCFRGCLDDCVGHLGPPPCVGFALQPECHDACNSLDPSYQCLLTVGADATHECHMKFGEASSIPEGGCPFR